MSSPVDSENQKRYVISSRIWISSEDGTILGGGRIELLIKIDKLGSISKAAKEMGMSYKKAWELVNSMNAHFPRPLVTAAVGGLNGGGSCLSETGKEMVRLFRSLEVRNQAFLEEELNKMDFFK